MIIIAATLGVLFGGLVAYLAQSRKLLKYTADLAQLDQVRSSCREGQAALKDAQEERGRLLTQLGELRARQEETLKYAEEKEALLKEGQERLSNTFKALSAEALKSNNQSFLDLAQSTLERFQERAQGDLSKREVAIQQLIKPVRESLERFDTTVKGIEKERNHAYGSLSEQLKTMANTQSKLELETSHLVKALRTPHVRGQWGELQLRRSVELAGMLSYVDFFEQESAQADDKLQRPDMIVRLPNGRNVVVDAKAPMVAYLEALEKREEKDIKNRLQAHARHIREHIQKLSQKAYWRQFDPTPEFVVLFLPGESFFSAALEEDPRLIDYGVEQKVILATPTTLIALLRSVALGWQQAGIAEEAQNISKLGRELYERVAILGGHFGELQKSLERTVSAYNKTVRSLETRVLPTARKLQELPIGSDVTIDRLEVSQAVPVLPQAVELEEEVSVTASE